MVSCNLKRLSGVLLLAVLAPLLLTQCKTTVRSYKDVSYDPAKLKTPVGHGMERNDYPFDEQGNYRKDWVKNDTGGRDPSAIKRPDPAPVTADAATLASAEPAASSGHAGYPTYAEAAAARKSGNFVGPAGNAASGSLTIPTTAGVPETAAMTLAEAGSGSTPVVLASAGSTVTAAPAAAQYHRVVSGDTLYAIANRYGTNLSDLKRVNGLTSDQIRPGQSLRLP
ncbi:MAG: LysM peptidoglycan-binding domain-containing protein [Verrucomicrobiae bacterium]|nr:LysM peptidoglycan-binding domain-containing protein [Verrucomicrobiae bacterium]